MNLYLKIAFTLIIIWIIGWILIFPSTPIAKWGTKKFGGYENFAVLTAGVLTAPMIIEVLVYIWCEL